MSLTMIMSQGMYAVPSKRRKDNLSKIDISQGDTIRDCVVQRLLNGKENKLLCHVPKPERMTTRIKNGEVGKSGKPKATRVVLFDYNTYTFEMLIERFGSPRKFPAGMAEKHADRIGKNRNGK